MTDEEIVEAIATKVLNGKLPDPEWDCYSDEALPFNPFTSDADACAVLDKMAENYSLVVTKNLDEHEWYVGFRAPDDSMCGWTTKPERRRAICLAALMAVGVQTE